MTRTTFRTCNHDIGETVYDIAVYSTMIPYNLGGKEFRFESLHNDTVRLYPVSDDPEHNTLLCKCLKNAKNGRNTFVRIYWGPEIGRVREVYSDDQVIALIGKEGKDTLLGYLKEAEEWNKDIL
jgi:hypothetical protein